MDTWFAKLMVIEAIIEADNEMQRIKRQNWYVTRNLGRKLSK